MSALAEYFESGNAPHEALGRAARRLSSGGALYLGAGVGVEKQQTPKGEVFHVTNAAGKPETFSGPLSAVIRAFAKAGSSTGIDSPGGATVVADPAAAARLRELADEEAEARRDIDRFVARLKRRQAQASRGIGIGYSPIRADDDQWEQRRIEELKSDLGRIVAERTRLLASGKVEEVEQARPGTNFTKIPPKNVAKLKGIIEHYRGMAHPFSTCVRDQVKHGLSEDHANRRCAVVKDLATGTTKWRKGGKGKVAEELAAALAAALERVEVVEQTLGTGMAYALAEGVPGAPASMVELGEALGNDFALLALSGHPLAEMLFESFSEHLHPRDFMGQFRKKVGGLKHGESASVPGGVTVKRQHGYYFMSGGGGAERQIPGAADAARAAVDRSLRSTDPKSLGGATSYSRGLPDYEKRNDADLPAGTYIKLKDENTRGIVRSVDRGVHKVELEGDSDALHRYSRRELEELPKADASGMTPGQLALLKDFGIDPKVGKGKPVRVISRSQATDEAAGSWTGSWNTNIPDSQVVAHLDRGAKVKHVIVSDQAWNERAKRKGGELPTTKRATLGSAQGAARQAEVADIARKTAAKKPDFIFGDTNDPNSLGAGAKAAAKHAKAAAARSAPAAARARTGASRDVSSGAALRDQIRAKLASLPVGGRYSVVNGQGNPVGHVEKKEKGFEVVLPTGIRSTVMAGAAALYVDQFERKAKAAENARQVQRGRNLGLREGVLGALLDAPLREAFGSGTGSGTPSASRDARRNVKKKQGAAASSGSGSFDESKHKRGSAGSSQGGKFVAMGGSGSDVRAVQAKVGAKTDGSFGAKTKQAVMDFQRRHGLTVDGVVGHQTAVALAGNYKAAKTAKVGALKGSDRSKLKGLRSTPRRGRAPQRSRGGAQV